MRGVVSGSHRRLTVVRGGCLTVVSGVGRRHGCLVCGVRAAGAAFVRDGGRKGVRKGGRNRRVADAADGHGGGRARRLESAARAKIFVNFISKHLQSINFVPENLMHRTILISDIKINVQQLWLKPSSSIISVCT